MVMVKKSKKIKKQESIENFVKEQMKMYIKIHKKHEKELTYIG